MSPPEFSFGDLVHDRDDDEPDVLVVVNTPPVTADDWDVPAIRKTVAEDNPGYPEDAAVVVVVYRDQLEETLPTGRNTTAPTRSPNSTSEPSTTTRFPRHASLPRATQTPGKKAGNAERETVVRMADLKGRLDAANWTTELADDGLTVEKLGGCYLIHPDGEIEGQGGVREPLANLVDTYIE